MTGMPLSDAAWLTGGPLARLLALLDADGEEARAVGGAVRNALIGLPVEEIDVATTASPEEVMRRAARAHIRAVPTGIDHGTVTLIVDGRPFEVTTLREDVETYGRKAKVEYGRDWKKDAERRDFTINALSASRDGRLHDYVGGLADLRARRVRFIGDAAMRIAEDYLRILRFFRFHSAYGEGPPDRAALAACIAARAGLEMLSRERVRAEMLKLLAAPRAVEALSVMSDAGLLVTILGGVPLVGSARTLVALEERLRLPRDPLRVLGALALFVEEDADRLLRRLRLSNAEHRRLAAMAQGWWRVTAALRPRDARALLYRLGPEDYRDRLLLAWSRSGDALDDARWADLVALPARWTAPALPIAAADLMTRGVAKGPALGAALRAAEAAWIAADFPNDAASLAAIADGVAAAERPPQ